MSVSQGRRKQGPRELTPSSWSPPGGASLGRGCPDCGGRCSLFAGAASESTGRPCVFVAPPAAGQAGSELSWGLSRARVPQAAGCTQPEPSGPGAVTWSQDPASFLKAVSCRLEEPELTLSENTRANMQSRCYSYFEEGFCTCSHFYQLSFDQNGLQQTLRSMFTWEV